MRTCPNSKCVAFGRIVYSVATRCPLCRWDLKNEVPAGEVAIREKPTAQASSAR